MADHEAARVLTGQPVKTGEFGFPQGHLGHLTEEQQLALVQFKELCEEGGLYRPGTDHAPASHDDTTLLRFLRARRFRPHDALQQFRATEGWRQTNQITRLYDNIDVGEYEQTRRLYPQWTGRRDRRGIPVYVFEVAPLNSKTMSAYAKSVEKTTVVGQERARPKKDDGADTVPPRLLRLFALYENLVEFTLPLCTKLMDRPHPDTPISQSNNIVDISNVGLKQFWNLRSHMQDASVLATAHYPETLDRIFIVGAPSFFPTVWGWIKRWFDPITTSKIFILSEHNAYKTLSAFIDPANIPKKYGGQLDWRWGQTPTLDPVEDEHLHFTTPSRWPQGPLRWMRRDGLDDKWQLMAVGSVGGKERRDVVATFHLDHVRVARTQPGTPAVEMANFLAPAPADAPRPPSNHAPAASGPGPSEAGRGKDVPVPTMAEALLRSNGAPVLVPAVQEEPQVVTAALSAVAVAPVAATPNGHAPSPSQSPSQSQNQNENQNQNQSQNRTRSQNQDQKPETVVVRESAPIPPFPMVTPSVPLSAIASTLPTTPPATHPPPTWSNGEAT